MRPLRVFLPVSLLVAAFLPVCQAGDVIRVGIVLPLTGTQAFFGEMERDAFELALEEINGRGGVRGARLEFLIEDDRSRLDDGVAAAEKLIEQDQVVMLGGGYSSSVTAGLVEVAQRKQVPLLINTAAANQLTQEDRRWVFRLNPPASEYAAAAVDFLKAVVEPRSVAIIHEDGAFGRSQSRFFAEACRRAGIRVVLQESYSQEEFELWRVSQILLEVRRKKPDVIFMVSYLTDASLLMRQCRSLAWQPRLYVGGAAGFTMPAFPELARDDADNVVTVTLWHESLPYAGARRFHDRYEAVFGREADYHGAEAYAAAFVIADALERAETLAPGDIREALASTKMTTAFGPVEFVSFDGMSRQNRLSAYVAQWIGGELVLVWPPEVAGASLAE